MLRPLTLLAETAGACCDLQGARVKLVHMSSERVVARIKRRNLHFTEGAVFLEQAGIRLRSFTARYVAPVVGLLARLLASDLSSLHLLPLHGEREGLQVLDALSVVFVARVVRLAQDENHKLIAVNLREA